MNSHYICTGGCMGVADKPGVCQAPVCLKHGLPLTKCDCVDATHQGLVSACQDCGKLCRREGVCEVELYKTELVA
ncbi:MAG: hypothetical protein KBB70_02375 [Candidatus Pacebacteria bacterium]|nr:hypothetical protein [Candidatus Paceibacterota bacterium]